VVEVDCDDLRRHDRRQVLGVLDLDPAAVPGDEFDAVPDGLDGGTVEEDAAVFGHGRPF
jgi:hypothetical protein